MKIVIGDIHGCLQELLQLLDAIGPARDDEVYGLGDLIDRGPRSPEIVELFIKNGWRSTRGNHEHTHIRLYHGEILPHTVSEDHRATVRQFEGRYGKTAGISYADAIRFFESFPGYFDLPEAILVHGGIQYGVPLEAQNIRLLTGAMLRKNKRNYKSGLPLWADDYPQDAKPIIFGHMAVGKGEGRGIVNHEWPLPQRENLWPIDTGCVSGGFLTAVTLPDFKVHKVRSRVRKK